MNPITFTNQQPPKKSKVINIAVLLLIVAASFIDKDFRSGIIQAFSSRSDFNTFILIAVAGGIFVGLGYFLFFYKKINNTFTVDDEGVRIGNRKYLWNDVKNYHLLGDSQHERFGLVSVRNTGGFDPINPYYKMHQYVLVTKSGFVNNSFRLQVSEERVPEFEKILSSKGIQRNSKTRMYLTSVSPWFIILFVIPFGLFVLLMIFGGMISK